MKVTSDPLELNEKDEDECDEKLSYLEF